MRYASKEEVAKGILPVMNPLFNLREICKQSALLEDHLNNPRKRCPDCIRKHFLTIEAFYEEAVSLDKEFKFDEYLDGKAEMMRELQAEWLDARDTKKYGDVCTDISQRLRVIRKDFAPECFDLRKMASLREIKAPNLCRHMKLSSKDYSDFEDHMDIILHNFNKGKNTLYVDIEMENADYFGSFDGFFPPEKPSHIKGLYLLARNEMPRQYETSLMGAEYFYKSEYIPMVEAIIKGLKKEIEEIEEEYPNNSVTFRLEEHLEDFQDQLKKLKRNRMATLSQTEKEEREMERLVKKKPKKKPPRKDLMRKRVKVEDKDLENLGAGAGGDRDLSMNHKRVAHLVASRYLRKLAEEGEQKKKEPNSDFYNQAVEELSRSDRQLYDSEAENGGQVKFTTAISYDSKSKGYQQAQKAIASLAKTKQKAKVSEEATKRKVEKAKKKKTRVGLKKVLGEDPMTFVLLAQNGSPTNEADEFIEAIAEMTLSENFEDSVGFPAVEVLSQGEKANRDSQLYKLNQQLEGATDETVKESLEGQIQDLKEKFHEEDSDRNERNLEARKEKVKELLAGAKDVFGLEAKRKAKEDRLAELESKLEGQTQEGQEGQGQEGQEGNQQSTEEIQNEIKQLKKELGISDEEFPHYHSRQQDGEDSKAKSLKEESLAVLEGDTEDARKLAEESPTLKFLQDLHKANTSTQISDEEDTLERREADLIKRDFATKLKSAVGQLEVFGDSRLRRAVDKIISELDDLPADKMQKVQEGFFEASKNLSDAFMGQSSFTDSVSAIKQAIEDNNYEDKISGSSQPSDIGATIATMAMKAAFLDNFDYGVPSDDDLTITSTDSNGRTDSVINSAKVEGLVASQALRFRGTRDDDKDRRTEALASYKKKMQEAIDQGNDASVAKYRASYNGVLAAKLMEGDADVPAGLAKVDSFFLEHARQSNHPTAIQLVAELAQSGSVSDPRIRRKKLEYLNELDHDNFAQAVGGDRGDFTDLMEVIDPEYCPDIPLNGDSAGRKVPTKDCPVPVAPEIRKAIRETISKMVVDLYSIDPSGDFRNSKGGRGGFGDDDDEGSESTKAYDKLLKTNKKELIKALGMPTGEAREKALAWLMFQMRKASFEHKFSFSDSFSELDKAEKGLDEKKLLEFRVKKLKELFEKANEGDNVETINKVLEQIEEELNTETSSGGYSNRFSRRASARRIASVKFVAQKFISNTMFISTCLSSDPEGDTPMRRQATSYVDYQQRARQFEIGMRVYPYFGGKPDKSGVVVQIFPAIGMVDVQFPHGVSRYPVEDLVLDTSGDYENLANTPDSIPGGRGVVPVSSGSAKSLITDSSKKRVASLYMKKLMRR